MKLTYSPFLDVGWLYNLLKQRPKHERISHRKMPTPMEHYEFVIGMPYREWWTIAYDGVPCGTVYLSKQREIGVHLLQKFFHRGIEARAIRWMVSRHKTERLYCNVAPGDKGRRYVMDMLGWKKLQVVYVRK